MKKLLAVVVFALAACEEPTPPHPAAVALQAACDGGDLDACAQVLAYSQRQEAMRQQAWQAYSSQAAANQRAQQQANVDLWSQTMRTPTQTRCIPTGYGMVNCSSY